ncbi:WD40-repeat-containing domain protein [Pilobolus umbonatus]|nr:WD40-repeat-containing domain protein [Pilobolus umbonatus]
MSTRFPFTKLIHNPTQPQLVLANGQHFLAVNTSTGEVTRKYPAEKLEKVTDYFRSLAFNKEGTLLASSGEDKEVRVWNTSDWTVKVARPAHKRVNALRFNNDSSIVVVADKFGDVYCHPVKEATEEDKHMLPIVGHVSLVTDMTLTPDEKYVITSDRDEHIRVSRFPNGYNIESFCLGHTDVVTFIEVLPWNESTLVSAGGDGFIRLWNYEKGIQLHALDLKQHIAPYKPTAADANSEEAIINHLTFDKDTNTVVVSFAKSKALIVLEWNGELLSYKETIVTSLPVLDVTFDNSNQLWVSSDPASETDDLITVYRQQDGKFIAVDKEDALVKQVNSTEVCKVDVIPDLYTIFGLRKLLDVPENLIEEHNKRKKTA